MAVIRVAGRWFHKLTMMMDSWGRLAYRTFNIFNEKQCAESTESTVELVQLKELER